MRPVPLAANDHGKHPVARTGTRNRT